MPGWILTDNEREQWNQVPAKIAPSDLIIYFTLSVAELDLVRQHRGQHNRLGFALQLLTLRYLGFCPEQLATIPVIVVAHVAQQLGVTPNALIAYGDRAQTRTEHFQEIQAYLGFRPAGAKELRALARWLLERALEHDKLKLLLQLSCDRLFVQKIVRPGITVIERLVVKARARAQQETFRRLKLVLTPQRQRFLDELLVYDDSLGYTPLTWLRRSGKSNSPLVIRNALAKLAFLEQQGVENWDMSQLNPNRLKSLALLGKRATNQALQRAPVIRRYPILIAFCRQIYEEVTDEVIDLYNSCLAQTYARARQDLEEFRLDAATAINEKLCLLRELGSIVLDIEVVDEQVREYIYQRVSPQKLQAAIEECTRLIRPANNDTYFDFLGSRYGYIRQFAANFLATFTFHSHLQPNPLLDAVALLRKLNAEGKRKLPENISLDFVPSKWRAYVVNDSNQIV